MARKPHGEVGADRRTYAGLLPFAGHRQRPGGGQGKADEHSGHDHARRRPGQSRDRSGQRGSRQPCGVERHRVEAVGAGESFGRDDVRQLGGPAAGEGGSQQAREHRDQHGEGDRDAAEGHQNDDERGGVTRQSPGQQAARPGGPVEQYAEKGAADRGRDHDARQERRGHGGRSSDGEPGEEQGRARHLVAGASGGRSGGVASQRVTLFHPDHVTHVTQNHARCVTLAVCSP